MHRTCIYFYVRRLIFFFFCKKMKAATKIVFLFSLFPQIFFDDVLVQQIILMVTKI